jgi:hypothetical protein
MCSCKCHAISLITKTVQLKVENSATFSLSPLALALPVLSQITYLNLAPSQLFCIIGISESFKIFPTLTIRDYLIRDYYMAPLPLLK